MGKRGCGQRESKMILCPLFWLVFNHIYCEITKNFKGAFKKVFYLLVSFQKAVEHRPGSSSVMWEEKSIHITGLVKIR